MAVGVSMFIGGHVDRIILSRPGSAGENLAICRRYEGQVRILHAGRSDDALNEFLPGQTAGQADEEKKNRDRKTVAFMRGRTLSMLLLYWTKAPRTRPSCR